MKLTTTHYIIIGIIVLSLILYFMKDKIKSAFARGLQNNNPGNIDRQVDPTTGKYMNVGDAGYQPWKGEIRSDDSRFRKFARREDGYRAMFVNLRGYFSHGLNTIDKIVTTWAPAKDNNNTKAYIAAVAKQTGIDPQKQLSFTDIPSIRKIVAAISQHENGVPADMDEVDSGFKILNT